MTTPKEILEKKVRRHRWTWNNYTEADVEHLKSFSEKDCDYIVFGREIAPTTGTPHLQGYVEWRNGTSGQTLQNKFGSNKIWVFTCQAARDFNIKYCKKGEQPKDEWNTLKDKGSNYGLNADIVELTFKEKHQGKASEFTALYEAMLDTPDYAELLEQHAELCIKYSTGVKTALTEIKAREAKAKLKQRFEGCQFTKWQKSLIDELKYTEPNDRTVIWYIDDSDNGGRGGKKGKTWLSKYILSHMNAARFVNAKSSDLAHAYNDEEIVIFDLTRSNEGAVNYSIMESFKDGMLFSPKYNSHSKIFASPHLIVFANWAPDMEKMSADRWVIRRFKDGDCDFVNEDAPESPIIVEPIVEPIIEPINEPINEEWYECDDCLESFNASHPCGCFKSH